MVKLNSSEKLILESCKKIFQENNLSLFYEIMADAIHNDNSFYEIPNTDKVIEIDIETIEIFSRFFEENGIYIENYLNYIPDYYCYLPERWLGKNNYFWLPDNIRSVNWGAFDTTRPAKNLGIVFTNVENIGSYVLENSYIKNLVLTENLKKISSNAFMYSDLEKIFIPKKYYNDIDNAPDVFRQVKKICNHLGISLIGYTNL